MPENLYLCTRRNTFSMNIQRLLPGCLLLFCVLCRLAAQDEKAPNDIPIPWYSQKISGCPYAHCSLASSLMVFDYYKGYTVDRQRSAREAEQKLIEYQKEYFLKKKAPFRRRTSIAQGGYHAFEIDSLARYYEGMVSAEPYSNKDYKVLKAYIDQGIPVLINVRYRSSTTGLIPGNHGHWMVLRGMTDTHVWINDPGRSSEMRDKGENRKYPIRRERGNPSWFDGCWTGRFIVITPRDRSYATLARVRQPDPLEESMAIPPSFLFSYPAIPEIITQ